MNIERTAELERRADIHAALADPARLQIVDTLSLGDASPSELQELLAMPSNLVAHHLKVLEGVGLVGRARSEADRRRSYVRLVPAALEEIGLHATVRASRVVFVCTANSARSQLAAALWRQASQVPVESAGTHPAAHIDPGAVSAARRHKLSLQGHRPRALTASRAGDVVITVCDNAHEELGNVAGLHWSVPDPVRVGSDAAFDAAYDDLHRRVDQLAPRLAAS